MKKIKLSDIWDSLPLASKTKSGLLDKSNYPYINGQFSLRYPYPNTEIKTNIPINTPQMYVMLELKGGGIVLNIHNSISTFSISKTSLTNWKSVKSGTQNIVAKFYESTEGYLCINFEFTNNSSFFTGSIRASRDINDGLLDLKILSISSVVPPLTPIATQTI